MCDPSAGAKSLDRTAVQRRRHSSSIRARLLQGRISATLSVSVLLYLAPGRPVPSRGWETLSPVVRLTVTQHAALDATSTGIDLAMNLTAAPVRWAPHHRPRG